MAGPSTAQLLSALAAATAAGLTPSEACSTIARAGPASARLARRLDEAMQGKGLTAALGVVVGLDAEERLVLALGEEAGELGAALRWASERRAARRARFVALRGVVIAPLLITVTTVLTEPLPAVALGTGSMWPTVRALLWACGATLAAWLIVRRLLTLPRVAAGVRALGRAIPLWSRLVRIDDEARCAALVATFARDGSLGVAPRAARALLPAAQAHALERADAEPLAALSSLSEPLALALAVGQRTRALADRLAEFRRDAEARVTARLKLLVQLVAWSAVLITALHAGRQLMTMQLPGLGGDLGGLGNMPELKELERELDGVK